MLPTAQPRKKVEIFELEDSAEPAPLPQRSVPSPESPDRPRLYIAIPAYGCLVHNSFMASVLSLHVECLKRGIVCVTDTLGNESLITRARSVLTARFLRSNCSHLLWLDSDLMFDPQTIFRLLDFDKQVVCCAYPKKMCDYDRVVKSVLESTEEARRMITSTGLDYNINIVGETYCENGFIKVLDAATGMMLMRREAVEALCKAHPELEVENDILSSRVDTPTYVHLWECTLDYINEQKTKKRLLSEDYAVSRKLQNIGIDVWMDIASPIAHIGGQMASGDIRKRMKLVLAE